MRWPAEDPATLAAGMLFFRECFFSVFSVAQERLNTEAAETLRVPCVEPFKAAESTERFASAAAPPRCELPVRAALAASLLRLAPLQIAESSFDEVQRHLV